MALAASAACLLVLLGATAGTNVVRVTRQDTWDGIFNKINRNFASVETLATNAGAPWVGFGAGNDSNVVYFTGSPSNEVNSNPFYSSPDYPAYPAEDARYTNAAGYYMVFNPGGPTWSMFTPGNDGAGGRTGADQSLPVGAWQGDIANGSAAYGTNFVHPVYGASSNIVVTNGMILRFSNGVFIGRS